MAGPKLYAAVERALAAGAAPGPDKTATLPEAISKHVRPGMALHFSTTHNRPGAAIVELIRAFRGKDPGFTVSCLGFTGSANMLVHAGLVGKAITSFMGDSYPTPGPNPIIGRAWKEGRLEIENWSILTIPQRLAAGAMGLSWFPTKSLAGSGMAANEGYVEADIGGEKTGMVAALRPDLAFIHVPMADAAGNCLLTPPLGEGPAAVFAAKEGAIVTADVIVETDVIRRQSSLCRVPGHYVRAVCEAPLGAHPGGVSSQGLPEFDAYADDYDFTLEVREACKTPESADRWIADWVDGCPSWDAYLARLGHKRIWSLKGKARPDSWRAEILEAAEGGVGQNAPPTPAERMVCAAAEAVAERVKSEGYRTILAGVGTSNLAAWLAWVRLREEGADVDLIAEIGFFGYSPRPADPFIFNYRNMPAAKALTDIMSVMGVFMGGAENRCIGVIGAGQVDARGNINSTMVPGVAYLTGSGGANDICSAAREVVVTVPSGKGRLAAELGYVTCPGDKVGTVVTDLYVLGKAKAGGSLELAALIDRGAQDSETGDDMAAADNSNYIHSLRNTCGFDLGELSSSYPIMAPSSQDIELMRIFDPKGQFLG